MPVPLGTNTDLAAYLNDLEARVGLIENPQGPTPLWPSLKAKLPAPVGYINSFAYVTDTNIPVYSDGVVWRRVDTGSAI